MCLLHIATISSTVSIHLLHQNMYLPKASQLQVADPSWFHWECLVKYSISKLCGCKWAIKTPILPCAFHVLPMAFWLWIWWFVCWETNPFHFWRYEYDVGWVFPLLRKDTRWIVGGSRESFVFVCLLSNCLHCKRTVCGWRVWGMYRRPHDAVPESRNTRGQRTQNVAWRVTIRRGNCKQEGFS